MNDSNKKFTISRKRLYRKKCAEPEDELSEHKRLMANGQERVRMRRINAALEDLKEALPDDYHPCRRRMSKIRTLRCAMDYISGLSHLIEEDNERRRLLYMQARDYVYTVCKDPRSSAVVTDNSSFRTPDSTNSFQTPYLPHIAGALSDEFRTQMYQTPHDQTPYKQMLMNPRHLNFDAPVKRQQPATCNDVTPIPDTLVAGATADYDTSKQNIPMSDYSEYCITPGVCGPAQRLSRSRRSETFPSPFVGGRHDNELGTSFNGDLHDSHTTAEKTDAARGSCARAEADHK